MKNNAVLVDDYIITNNSVSLKKKCSIVAVFFQNLYCFVLFFKHSVKNIRHPCVQIHFELPVKSLLAL